MRISLRICLWRVIAIGRTDPWRHHFVGGVTFQWEELLPIFSPFSFENTFSPCRPRKVTARNDAHPLYINYFSKILYFSSWFFRLCWDGYYMCFWPSPSSAFGKQKQGSVFCVSDESKLGRALLCFHRTVREKITAIPQTNSNDLV